MAKKLLINLLALLFLIFFDQASKEFFITFLETKPNNILHLWPILDFIYAWNHGISFGLFSEHHQYSNLAFLLLNGTILLYLCYILTKPQNYCQQFGLVLIIGGAIGNLIDRIYRGAVFDFIYFHYADFAFPAFNLADSFITIGITFWICNYLFISPSKLIQQSK